ncbi:MAG: alpha/beta fold hydrolase [Phormidesmis sp.]
MIVENNVLDTGRNPVVLVHGIWNTASIFSVLQRYLESAGWRVYALSMIPNNGDAPISVLAEQVAAFVEDRLGRSQPFDLVGFSMGGLVSRYYLQRLGGLARVQRFVSVSTPHQGTALALFSQRLGVSQMRPGSPLLKSLNQDIHTLETIRFFSLWTPFDLLILPPWSSDMGLGQVEMLPIGAHNRMIRDEVGLRAIAKALDCKT